MPIIVKITVALFCAPLFAAYPEVDYFTRISNSSIGASWTVTGGASAFAISNFYAINNGASTTTAAVWVATATPNNTQYSYLVTDSWAGRNGEAASGVLLRGNDTATNYYSCQIIASNSGVRKVRISRWDANVETVLLDGATSSPSIPDGSKLIGWVNGSTLNCKLMDSAGADILSTITTTDSTYASGRVGIMRGTNSQNITWREWWGGEGTGSDIYVPPTAAGQYYLSSTATSHNAAGTIDDPWPWADFFANQTRLLPGSTLWFRGGTYTPTTIRPIYQASGVFLEFTQDGTVTDRIRYASYPGEAVVFDLAASCDSYSGVALMTGTGDYSTFDGGFHGWRFTNSDGSCKVITRCGSNPSPNQLKAMYNRGLYNIYRNLVWHDIGTGLGDNGASANGSEFDGQIVFNSGWNAPDRGHGHGMYAHNDGYATITKYIKNSIFLRNQEQALQLYSQSGAPVGNFTVDSTMAVSGRNDSGTWRGAGTGEGIIVQGATPDNIVFNKLYTYAGNLRFNLDIVQAANFTMTNSIQDGGLEINRTDDAVLTDNVLSRYGTPTGSATFFTNYSSGTYADVYADIDRNRYVNGRTGGTNFKVNAAQHTFASFVALGMNAASTFDDTNYPATGTSPSGSATNYVRVLPSTSHPGTGNVVVFNWQGLSSVNADVSTILSVGDPYEVLDAQNWTGGPVATGTYAGGNIALDMTLTTIQAPVGSYDASPGLTCTAGSDGGSPSAHDNTFYQHTETYFGAFLVRRRQVYRQVVQSTPNTYSGATQVTVESGPSASDLSFPPVTVACSFGSTCSAAINTQMVGNTFYRQTFKDGSGATIHQRVVLRVPVN